MSDFITCELQKVLRLVWFLCVGAFVIAFLILAWVKRPSAAMSIVMLASCIPIWWAMPVLDEPLNVRLAVALGALGCYSFLPNAHFPWRLVPCDYAVLALFGTAIFSDFANSEISVAPAVFAYCEWIVPYLVGRLAISSREDISIVWRVMVFVTLFLGVFGLIETLGRFNALEIVFGQRPEEGFPLDSMRWGLRRASASCAHPLYLGVLFSWLLGWCILGFWRAIDRRAHWLWMLIPFLAIGLPIVTGSRGPVLVSLVVVIPIVSMFAINKLRIPLAVVGGLVLLLAVFNLETLMGKLDQWTGETARGRRLREVTFRDETVKVSSARARMTLFRIYAKPMMNAGLLGYGTDSVIGFPVKVPMGIDESKAAEQIWSLDNSYILMVLRFGYVGLACFLSIVICSVTQLIWVYSRAESRSVQACSACLTASTLAMVVLFLIVWMPMDLSFPWLFGIGLSSALYYHCRKEQLELD